MAAERRHRILCVEDDPEAVQQIAEELGERGFEVLVAEDGAEGLITILKTVPDLVLCASGLTGMTSFELLERIRELSSHLGYIPFVILAALSDRENELRARRVGADDYVSKPIDFDMLEVILKARLARVSRLETGPKLAKLNDREAAVLTWVARGKTSSEIAAKLGLAKRTVDFHLDNARTKLKAATRTEAVIKAAFGRLIAP